MAYHRNIIKRLNHAPVIIITEKPSSISSDQDGRRTASPNPSESDSISRNGGGEGLSSAKSIADIQKRAVCGWTGALVLKNSSFPSKFYVLDGDWEGVEGLLKDEEGKAFLRITQRLRLDQVSIFLYQISETKGCSN
jgi:hypothetical protein